MPLNLDHFLNIATNRTTSEIYIAGPDHQTTAQTRGSLKSWLVSIFKGDQTRNQRTETAHAFIAALQEKVAAKTSGLGNVRQELKAQYDQDTGHIVESLKGMLANQLNGHRGLTANDIRRATEFVDSTLELAETQKDNLFATMNREEALVHLETAALQFYGRENLEDINLMDSVAQANTDIDRARQEQAMASKGIKVHNRVPPPPTQDSLAKLLRGYLNGNPEKMSYEKASEIMTKLRSDLQEIRGTCSVAIPLFEKLSNGQTVDSNRWTNGVEPGSQEAKDYLNQFKTLQQEYLGPMKALEYFLRADVAEMRRDRFLDSKELSLNNGNTIQSERSIREILDDFQDGKQILPNEVAFLGSALNSRSFTQVNQTRPGFLLFSNGGNPGVLMNDTLDGVALVPNHIWQVVTDQAEPDRTEIAFEPSEQNPWALAINQKIMLRADEVHNFDKAQKGLAELLNYAVKSNGNLEEARRLQAEEDVPKGHKRGWKESNKVLNTATLRRENELNDTDRRFSPEIFARGVNRSLNIDPSATPSRPSANSGKEFTHGYDDDIDAGRTEASNPSNPINRAKQEAPKEGEAPRRSALSKALSGNQQTLNVVKFYAQKYAFESEFIQDFAKEQNIDLTKFSPNHQELYKTFLFHQAKTIGTDSPQQFNDNSIEKLAKKALTYLSSLNNAEAQTSVARITQLHEAGETLLASVTEDQIPGLSEKRQPLGKALINFVSQMNATDLLMDLATPKPGELVSGYELGFARIAAADIAFSGIDIPTQQQILNSTLGENSLLRAAYLATGANDKNPAIDNNDGLNASVIEFTEGLNYIVQYLGQNTGASDASISDSVNGFMQTFGTAKYRDFTAPNSATATVSAQAKEIFDTITPFINQRATAIRATANNFDN